jgi:SAM-dependent methyltransferase
MSFDRLARVYEPLERLVMGRALHRCRTAFLSEVRGVRRVLILGEGDGRFLEDFLGVNSVARVDCLDGSPAMIARARKRLARTGLDQPGRVHFSCADARSWQATGREYDLIVTHFFLDCFGPAEAARLVAKVGGWACPGAVWLLGEFNLPPGGPARWRARLWVSLLYLIFRAVTGITARRLPEFKPMLVEGGFRLKAERQTEAGMLVSQLWSSGAKQYGSSSLEGVAEEIHSGEDERPEQAHFQGVRGEIGNPNEGEAPDEGDHGGLALAIDYKAGPHRSPEERSGQERETDVKARKHDRRHYTETERGFNAKAVPASFSPFTAGTGFYS